MGLTLEQIDQRLDVFPCYLAYMIDLKLMMYRKEGRWPDFDKVHGIFHSRARGRSQMLPITFDHWLYAEGHFRLLNNWNEEFKATKAAYESVSKTAHQELDEDEAAVFMSYIWEPAEGVLDIKQTAKMFVPAYPDVVDKYGYILQAGKSVLDTVRWLWGIPDDLAPQIRKKPYGSQ